MGGVHGGVFRGRGAANEDSKGARRGAGALRMASASTNVYNTNANAIQKGVVRSLKS